MKSSPMHSDHVNAVRLARKCCAAADLAVSAYGVGSEEESGTAAYMAGQLAYKAGRTTDELAEACPPLVTTGECWWWAVEGWYAARNELAAAA